MKIFLFSRRFLIPFLLVWMLSLTFFGWEMWQLYKDDFDGKGLPASLKWEWLGYLVGGSVLFVGFLSGLLVGISFYSHQFLKKDSRAYRPFARLPLLLLTILCLVGFLFNSYFEPRNNYRGKQLLTDIVFYKAGSPFVRDTIGIKPPWCMTLTELFREKKEIRKSAIVGYKKEQRGRVNFEIARKIALPLSVFILYIMGILLGAIFRRSYGIFPLLMSYFVLFTGWSYCNVVFEKMYKRHWISPFWGAFTPLLFFTLLTAAALYIALKKKVFQKEQPVDLLLSDQD